MFERDQTLVIENQHHIKSQLLCQLSYAPINDLRILQIGFAITLHYLFFPGYSARGLHAPYGCGSIRRDDVVAVENRTRLVAADSHGFPLRHASVSLDYESPDAAGREQADHYSGFADIRLPAWSRGSFRAPQQRTHAPIPFGDSYPKKFSRPSVRSRLAELQTTRGAGTTRRKDQSVDAPR